MKLKGLYIFTLFLFGIVIFSSGTVSNHKSPTAGYSSIIAKPSPLNSDKQTTGDSPFIRFHRATHVGGISISSPNELIVFLKPLNTTPEKFAGIVEYISSAYHKTPVSRAFLYLRPLRSPPFFC